MSSSVHAWVSLVPELVIILTRKEKKPHVWKWTSCSVREVLMQSKRSMKNSKLNTPGGNTRATTWGLPAWTVTSRVYSKSWTGPAGGRGGKQLLYGLEDSEVFFFFCSSHTLPPSPPPPQKKKTKKKKKKTPTHAHTHSPLHAWPSPFLLL